LGFQMAGILARNDAVYTYCSRRDRHQARTYESARIHLNPISHGGRSGDNAPVLKQAKSERRTRTLVAYSCSLESALEGTST